MCRVIAVANQKGGVAKSSVVANLGIGLARSGKKVLLIDLDSQGSLTASLGFQEPDEIGYTVSTVLGKLIRDEEVDLEEGLLHHEEGVDLLPGSIQLAGMEQTLANEIGREHFLSGYVGRIRDRYDLILLDCMPSLGVVTVNALTAADGVLIPLLAEYLSVKGLEQLIKTVGRVKRNLNAGIVIDGLLFTMVNYRTKYGREITELLRENYGSHIRIFESQIPASVRAAETSALGISIFAHDPRGKVAAAYRSLVEEVLAVA